MPIHSQSHRLRRWGLVLFALMGVACATTAGDIRRWGSRREFARICRVLSEGKPTVPVRIAAAEVIGGANYSPAVSFVIRLARDPSVEVRRAAVRALGHFSDEPARRAILRASEDNDTETAAAARSATMSWTAVEEDNLRSAIGSSDALVRAGAERVLARIGDRDVGPLLCQQARLDKSPLVRMEAARSLQAMIFGGCRDVLFGLKTSDPSPKVRVAAGQALAAVAADISKPKFLIVSPAQLPKGIAPSFRDHLNAALSQRILMSGIGQVLPPVAPCEDPVQEAPRLASESTADQIIAVTLVRDGESLVLILDRLSATGVTLHEEQVTGASVSVDSLIKQAVDALASEFNQ